MWAEQNTVEGSWWAGLSPLLHFPWAQLFHSHSCHCSDISSCSDGTAHPARACSSDHVRKAPSKFRKGSRCGLHNGGLFGWGKMHQGLRAVAVLRAPWKEKWSTYVSLSLSQVGGGRILGFEMVLVTHAEVVYKRKEGPCPWAKKENTHIPGGIMMYSNSCLSLLFRIGLFWPGVFAMWS